MSFLEPNTDGMTERQISHVESLKDSLRISVENESQWRVKSVEDWNKAEAMANEIEELKNALGQLKDDHAWAQKRIQKGLAVCASKDKEIERLQKFEDQILAL
jgi:phosphosulfolactate phosphohydrolase-like enzyme